MQFGVSGANFTGMGLEENKSAAVGRRDLFRLPGEESKASGAGRGAGQSNRNGGGAARNAAGRPPLQGGRRPNNFAARQAEEEKKAP